MEPVILRVTNNYKGKNENGTIAVRQITIPSQEAFYSLIQIACVPAPEVLASRSSLTRNPSISAKSMVDNVDSSRTRTSSLDERSISQANSNIGESSGSSSKNRLSEFQYRASILMETIGDSGKFGLDRTLKAMAIPKDEVARLSGRNFNIVMDAINTYEVNMKDAVIYPEAGFVIVAQRVKPLKRIVMNVCHHPSVGSMSQNIGERMQHNSSGGKGRGTTASFYSVGSADIPKPCPFIIGRVDDRYVDDEGHAMLVDVVIPSPVLSLVITDPSGDFKFQVST
jgi:hypothetical protein